MPTVDIIMPAYNAAKYLPAAIESVMAQTYEDWRILLVDDGSTDKTEELIEPIRQQLGPRLKYIKQENRGLPAARNAAIHHSSAEFLALLDADDVWLPNRLSDSLDCFKDHPSVGLTYGLITRIDADGNILQTFPGNPKHAAGKIAPYIYMRKVELPCPTITFRKKCMDEVGLFDESMRATEDRDLWLRIALRHDIGVVPNVIAYYRTSPSSMSADPQRMLKAQLQFIRKHYGAPGCGLYARQVALGRAYKQHAEALKLRNKPWSALRSSLRSMGLCPWDEDNMITLGSLLLACAGIRRTQTSH